MPVQVASLVQQTSFYGADRIHIMERSDSTVLLLADGAGGMSGAKEAAEWIIQAFTQVVEKHEGPLHLDDLEILVRELDTKLLCERNTGNTTFVAVVIRPNQIYGVSVGDSRCWHYTEHYQLELTAQQYRVPFLGTGQAVPVAFGPFASEGLLLVSSDGLFDELRQPAIDEIVLSSTNVDDIPKRLFARLTPNEKTLSDDISIIACQL